MCSVRHYFLARMSVTLVCGDFPNLGSAARIASATCEGARWP